MKKDLSLVILVFEIAGIVFLHTLKIKQSAKDPRQSSSTQLLVAKAEKKSKTTALLSTLSR